jgi:hypothetical protein
MNTYHVTLAAGLVMEIEAENIIKAAQWIDNYFETSKANEIKDFEFASRHEIVKVERIVK